MNSIFKAQLRVLSSLTVLGALSLPNVTFAEETKTYISKASANLQGEEKEFGADAASRAEKTGLNSPATPPTSPTASTAPIGVSLVEPHSASNFSETTFAATPFAATTFSAGTFSAATFSVENDTAGLAPAPTSPTPPTSTPTPSAPPPPRPATAPPIPPAPPASTAGPTPTASPISTKFIWSQTLDSVLAGGADSTLRLGGKMDAYIGVKGSALGLDDSVSLHLHPEFRYGKGSNGEVGLIPANILLFYPRDHGEVFDFSANITKRWSNGSSLTVGKFNLQDIAARFPVVGGGGHEGFQNLGLSLPPSGILPGSITGAIVFIPSKDVIFRGVLFDTKVASRRSGFEDPFAEGVGFMSVLTFPTRIGGKRGYYGIKVAASTRSQIAADGLPPVLVPAPGSAYGQKSGEFGVTLNFQQYLSESKTRPGNGIGLFGQIYWSNGDPTFLDASGFIGISGNPESRPQDRFGLAYFRYSLADGLISALSNRLALEDEQGVEMFYTLGLNKNFRFTANMQVVNSAISVRDELGVTAGLRLTSIF